MGCLTAATSGYAWLLAAAALSIAAIFDIRHRRIPNWLNAVAGGCGILLGIGQGTTHCAVIAALITMASISLPNLIRPGAIGAGDVKLVGVLGTLIGPAGTMIAVGAGAVGALVFQAHIRWVGGAATKIHPLPFAPFLFIGFLFVVAGVL